MKRSALALGWLCLSAAGMVAAVVLDSAGLAAVLGVGVGFYLETYFTNKTRETLESINTTEVDA